MDFKKGSDNNNFQDINENAQKIKKGLAKNLKGFIFLIVLVLILASLNSFIYIVAEDEVATVSILGDIQKVIVDRSNSLAVEQNKLDDNFSNVQVVNKKGLFFKIPFITTVEKNTSKLITYVSNSANIVTNDKIKYKVAMFAQWEISHPGLFKTSIGTVDNANSVIDEVAYAVIIEKINALQSETFLTDKDTLYEELDKSMAEINKRLETRGLVLKDIDIYRTILPDSNIESTYQKMIAERQAIAQEIRSEGKEQYQNTVSETDRRVAEINAEAIEEAEQIKGEADAEALEIYADGFSVDPEFYTFWRTLKSYENSIDEDTTIFLDKNNSYLNQFSDQE